MYQYWFNNYNKGTTWMQWAGNRGSWGERGQQRESMGTLSSFCSVFCKAKTTLKKVY